ncbi:MAG: alpha/beta hydrolase, partial [Muribaculaceae bacterium]|nr:alpha/beta hydrolase [Muribaculaceae bacterium]
MSLALVSLNAFAQKKTEILLWDENPLEQSETKSERIKAQDYKIDPAITVYTPKNPTGKTVLMCPGGGYTHQASGHEGHDMADWFNAQGITYAVLKYRLPYGDNTIPLADAEQAMRILRKYSTELGVDPKKVGIAGASAGGHLASTLATHYTSAETRPDFQILFYPVISMDANTTHMGSRKALLGDNPTDELVKLYSNALQITPDTPKAFIMLSSDDGAVPPANSIEYYSALIGNKVKATLHAYPVGGHGWGFRDKFPYKRKWTGELEKWLHEEIK